MKRLVVLEMRVLDDGNAHGTDAVRLEFGIKSFGNERFYDIFSDLGMEHPLNEIFGSLSFPESWQLGFRGGVGEDRFKFLFDRRRGRVQNDFPPAGTQDLDLFIVCIVIHRFLPQLSYRRRIGTELPMGFSDRPDTRGPRRGEWAERESNPHSFIRN